jgi:hypothetical protein
MRLGQKAQSKPDSSNPMDTQFRWQIRSRSNSLLDKLDTMQHLD